jgi:hypothetical protein
MKNVIRPGFYHRENSATSYDSICLKCFRTVSSQTTQDELEKDENTHVCERDVLLMSGDIKTTIINWPPTHISDTAILDEDKSGPFGDINDPASSSQHIDPVVTLDSPNIAR